ncbi:MAG: CRISPR-associated protein Cas4 [Bacteroidota bacterium]
MNITGTHFNYYFLCHRKLWLFANSIQMEQTSDIVREGKLIHETSYLQRSEKYTELELDGIKIDYYDAKRKVVHEVKKSTARETAHIWQVKYYLFILEKHGIQNPTGILEYPKLRQTEEVFLSTRDCEEIKEIIQHIHSIIHADCPEKLEQKYCKHCSYFDFCWTQE